MRPSASCTRACQLRPDMSQLKQLNFRLFAVRAELSTHQRESSQASRAVVASSTHHDDLQPYTEWGKLMAQSVAQLQTFSDSPHSFKIKGVSATDDHTGEQRQQILGSLQKQGRYASGAGIPVLFVKQPDNPVDPNAVAGQIGYVPAELTHLFDHFCSCGYSDWIWKPHNVPSALLGCSVTCNPTHRAAYTQVVPPQLVGLTDIKRWLPVHVWNTIEQQYSDRMLGCCQVTSLPSIPLFPNQAGSEDVLKPRVFPIWSLLEYHKTLKLEGFQALCAPLIFSLSLLDIDELAVPPAAASGRIGEHAGVVQELVEQLTHAYGDSEAAIAAAKASAADALLCCNSWYLNPQDGLHASHAWSPADVDRYLQCSWERKQRLRRQDYRLDISFLLQEGVLSDADWAGLPSQVKGVHGAPAV